METQSLSALDARLARLERSNRRLRFACALLLLVPVLAWTWPVRPPEIVQAGRFQLVDESGTVWAELRRDAEGPGLYLFDRAGTPRASLVHDDSQTALFLRDAAGDVRVGAAQFAHGGGGVALHGPAAKGAAVLYLKGEGSLTMYDTTGAVHHRFPPRNTD